MSLALAEKTEMYDTDLGTEAADLLLSRMRFPQQVKLSLEEIFDISSAIDAVRASIVGIGLDVQVKVLKEVVEKIEAKLTL